MYLSASLLYARLMARARLERRSERVLTLLERVLPVGFGDHSLLVVAACTLGWYAATTAAFGATLFGLLLLASPVTVLSLLFAFLFATAASCGFSTAGRTISPPDEERLLMAPLSDRRVYWLAFGGSDPLRHIEHLLVIPGVSGVAASAVLGDRLSLPALWVSLALASSTGCATALVVDRIVGAARVRRARRGARRASLAAYCLFSTLACGSGALASQIIVSWLSTLPADGNSLRAEPLVRWAFSLPGQALDVLSPLLWLSAHPASPVGALARWTVEGLGAGLASVALWAGPASLAAALLGAAGGAWYRDGWRGQRPERDLFDLAEACYVGLGRVLYRGDLLLEVQLRNLCRRRESTAGPFHLFGGPLLWFWVGLAWGAAPTLRSSDEAAAVFALLVGGWASSATVRTPFEALRVSLSFDGEGRQVGLYRAAGVGALDLYAAKLRAGRLIGGVPLCTLIALIAVVAGLSPAACVLLFAVGLAVWEVWPRVESLPGLASPHFAHEHPEELGTHHEQQELSELAESAGGTVSLLGFVLAGLLLGGWIAPGSFPWVAAPTTLAAAAGVSAILRLFGHRAAGLADRRDLPP